ncbi:copper chaperone PCu(A)C [uncultured Neptuniibacter sp.]|uniref:copper chaperone PCu(A)C n=1 Tax=uncultured Neptuniibacter sp. TaxID=502143 RepID=UPI002638B489|nr:copper chaperone PCu(A)C [uncultured Neptuniibacter sp.]
MIKSMLQRSFLLATLSAAPFAMAEVSVENGYARAVPPGQMNSASFMIINNSDASDIQLVSGSSSVAKVVELHTHTNENGVMKMRQVETITVPAEGSVALQPGGYHIMLIGLKTDLAEGGEIDLKLNFSDESSKLLTLPVKKVMGGMQGHHHKHH